MSVYIPKTSFTTRILITIRNIPLFIDNIITGIRWSRKKLSYADICKIEFNSFETPEFLYENMLIEKKQVGSKQFKKIVRKLKHNNVLKWKRHYFANFEYYDGGIWNLKITFKNNEVFEVSGDIIYPDNFKNIYEIFEEYIIVSNNLELNETIIDKWFKYKEEND